MTSHSVVLAIDPGKDKCGVAWLCVEKFTAADRVLESVIAREIVPRGEVVARIGEIAARYDNLEIVIGHATMSRVLREEIEAVVSIEVHVIDETGSTLEARPLYWQANPPRGWRKWMPLSSQVPPEPIDDFAAIILAARFMNDDVS